MDRSKVFSHIDREVDKHVERVRELVRHISVSPENRGILSCASLVKKYLEEIGCKVRLVETKGNPVVYGEYDAGADRTVLVYMMYDTMPADEPDWQVDPFKGEIVDMKPFGKVMIARGVYNTKGALAGFINAVKSVQDVEEELPVNLIFVAEGEEELGSRNLPEFVDSHSNELKKADVLYFPWPSEDINGKPIIYLGVKGIVYFELELSGKDWGRGPTEFGIHGSNKAWVDSPVWRFIQALATMTSRDGNKVLIEGFYDKVEVPTDEDLELVEKLRETFNEETFKHVNKVERFIGDKEGVEALKLYLFSPTLNIDGIWGGYTGPGTKTLLPHKVTAKLDVRLVPNMRTEDVLPIIRKHLDKHGFKEVKIRPLEMGYKWARMSYKHPYSQALIKSLREFGKEPEIWPTIAGSAPFSVFVDKLKIPFVCGGLGHGARAHAPNEYLVIGEDGPTGGLATMEKSFLAIIDNISKAKL